MRWILGDKKPLPTSPKERSKKRKLIEAVSINYFSLYKSPLGGFRGQKQNT